MHSVRDNDPILQNSHNHGMPMGIKTIFIFSSKNHSILKSGNLQIALDTERKMLCVSLLKGCMWPFLQTLRMWSLIVIPQIAGESFEPFFQYRALFRYGMRLISYLQMAEVLQNSFGTHCYYFLDVLF